MAVLLFEKNVPATSSGTMDLAGYAGESVHYEPEGFAPTRFEAFSTDDFTAGTLTLDLQRNGASVAGASIVLNDATQRAAVPLAGVGYQPGDRLSVAWASASLAPAATATVVAIVS